MSRCGSHTVHGYSSVQDHLFAKHKETCSDPPPCQERYGIAEEYI